MINYMRKNYHKRKKMKKKKKTHKKTRTRCLFLTHIALLDATNL